MMAAVYLLPVSFSGDFFGTIRARNFKFGVGVGHHERKRWVLSKMWKFIFQDGVRISISGFVYWP